MLLGSQPYYKTLIKIFIYYRLDILAINSLYCTVCLTILLLLLCFMHLTISFQAYNFFEFLFFNTCIVLI